MCMQNANILILYGRLFSYVLAHTYFCLVSVHTVICGIQLLPLSPPKIKFCNMRRANVILAALFTSLICFESALTVVAFSRLFPRQDACDLLFCLDNYWSTLGTSAQQTFDTFDAYLRGIFLQDQGIDAQTETIPKGQGLLLPGISSEWDSIQQTPELKIPTETQTSPQILPLTGSDPCNQYAPPVGAPELTSDEDESQKFRPCGVITAYIVVPSDCGSPENTNVEKILFGIDPEFKTSRSPWCQVGNGVMFWLGNLSPEQAMDLKGQAGGAVKIVMPDVQLRTEALTPAPELMAQWPTTPAAAGGTDGQGRRVKVRDLLEVQIRKYRNKEIPDPSLTFLSNAPEAPKADLRDYVYFKSAVQASQAQEEVRVYVIDRGYYKKNPDIPHNKLTYLYCLGYVPQPNEDEDDKTGGGGGSSCLVSKIGGKKFGVFPNGPAFTIVKIGPNLSSLFDAFGNVIRDRTSKPDLIGRAVVYISGHWRPAAAAPAQENEIDLDRDANAINLMQQAIQALLNLKVMVVTHAGTYNTESQGTQMRLSMPADLASTMDFITAGSVVPFVSPENPWWFGQTIIGTGTGPAVTVSAPGSGFCYSNIKGTNKVQPLPYTGSGLAGAVMTGLVAYFLAIPDLYRYFMAQPNFALAVKQYVVAMSYPRRNGLVSAVWNGLDARDTTRTVYNEPGGEPWIGIPYPGNPRFQ